MTQFEKIAGIIVLAEVAVIAFGFHVLNKKVKADMLMKYGTTDVNEMFANNK